MHSGAVLPDAVRSDAVLSDAVYRMRCYRCGAIGCGLSDAVQSSACKFSVAGLYPLRPVLGPVKESVSGKGRNGRDSNPLIHVSAVLPVRTSQCILHIGSFAGILYLSHYSMRCNSYQG